MGDVISGHSMSGWVRKQTDQTIESKPILACLWSLFWFLPLGSCLEFLPWCRQSIRQTNSSLPKLPLVRVFSQRQRSRAGRLGYKVLSPWSPGFSLSCRTPWLTKGYWKLEVHFWGLIEEGLPSTVILIAIIFNFTYNPWVTFLPIRIYTHVEYEASFYGTVL